MMQQQQQRRVSDFLHPQSPVGSDDGSRQEEISTAWWYDSNYPAAAVNLDRGNNPGPRSAEFTLYRNWVCDRGLPENIPDEVSRWLYAFGDDKQEEIEHLNDEITSLTVTNRRLERELATAAPAAPSADDITEMAHLKEQNAELAGENEQLVKRIATMEKRPSTEHLQETLDKVRSELATSYQALAALANIKGAPAAPGGAPGGVPDRTPNGTAGGTIPGGTAPGVKRWTWYWVS
jgi:hypothetical protein